MAYWGGVVESMAYLEMCQTPQTNQHRFAASHATRTSAWTSCSAPAKALFRGRTSLRAYRKPSGKGAAGSGGRPTTGTGRAPPRLTSRRTAATIWRAARRAAREQRATRAASANSQNGAASATQRSGAASGGGTAPSALAPSRRQRRRKACQSVCAITDAFGCGAAARAPRTETSLLPLVQMSLSMNVSAAGQLCGYSLGCP